jgi:hypothetical protein
MSTAVIPEPIAQLQLQLNEIRSTQPRGKRLPDSVWQAAVELAREHGVYSVAHHLRLDYAGVKRRVDVRGPTRLKNVVMAGAKFLNHASDPVDSAIATIRDVIRPNPSV